jgi:hypothetical protein
MRRALPFALLLASSFAVGDGKVDVTGRYQSNWDEVRLVQRGSHVTGTYVCCGGGTIEGDVIEDRVLRYRWHEPRGAGDGHGVWRIEGDHLEGTWGFGKSVDDGGPWTLDRAGSQLAR